MTLPRSCKLLLLSTTLVVATSVQVFAQEPPDFVDVSAEANAAWLHDVALPYETLDQLTTPVQMSGGVAAGDVDNDGDTDLYKTPAG